MGRLTQAKMPSPPTVAQKDGTCILFFQQPGHIIGAILKMRIVIIDKRSKEVFSHFLSVDIGFKDTQTTDIQPCGLYISGRKCFGKLGMGISFLHADPFGLPGLLHFRGLKKVYLAFGHFSGIAGNSNLIVISGTGFRKNVQGFSQGIQVTFLFPKDIAQFFVRCHLNLCRSLFLSVTVTNFPGTLQHIIVKANRVIESIELHSIYLHISPPS